uniref:DUF1279 domain-containing protein n=1 Tax=Amphiprion ocellaris TaxID=80972 RepID=A0AAQ5ZCD7_AMPOC
MLLCRTGRLSAAALGQAFKSGSFLVQTNGPWDVTVTARTVQRYRLLCASVGGADPSRAHLEKRKPAPPQNWNATFGFVTTDWGSLDRVATVAASLSKSVQREDGEVDTIRRPLVYAKRRQNSRGEPAAGNVWFTGSCELSRTMHTRASSTKSSEAVVRSKMAAGTSTFVLAYAIHKLFAPVRISITLVSVPLIVRYFRKTGLFKPPTPAP